jgi:hypothetical protein
MKKEIKWQAANGKELKIVVELVTSREINADGDKFAVDCCELHIRAYADAACVGYEEPVKITTHPGLVAKIGKIGLTQANYDLIMAAISEVKSTPEWQAKMAKKTAAEKAEKEYQKHATTMRKIMAQ